MPARRRASAAVAATDGPPDRAPIAALATAPGPAGISVVRLSGGGALQVAARVARRPSGRPLTDAKGGRCRVRIVRADSDEVLDEAIALIFRAPNSYTGEDLVELQGHGGALPSRRLLGPLSARGPRLP